MTEQLHPMVPPNILLNNWESDWFDERQNVDFLLIQAYQAGADAELDECCKWVSEESPIAATELRAARRPEAPAVEDLHAQIQALRAANLRMANAVAKQLPDRTKFFVDLMCDSNENL